MSSDRSDSRSSRSWDPVADWYFRWTGARGSDYHRKLAIPAALRLLQPAPDEAVLDLGCGAGVLAPHVARAGARPTGLDRSRTLISLARKHHGAHGAFQVGDAAAPDALPRDWLGRFDAAVFLLSLQDIDPLEGALEVAARALRRGGRVVLVLMHPCFRVPRQSAWGWDEGRRLQFRQVESYLSRLVVPIKEYGGGRRGATLTYHRPMHQYVNALGEAGFRLDRMEELPTHRTPPEGGREKAGRRAYREIPILMGLRAWKG